MEVTESRFQLKRGQNSLPEELESDMGLELVQLFIHSFIHSNKYSMSIGWAGELAIGQSTQWSAIREGPRIHA